MSSTATEATLIPDRRGECAEAVRAESGLVHDELRGVPASPGQATGVARILRRREDFDRVRPGDIVLCATASTVSVEILAKSGGVVIEAGGALSNLAIMAREYGVPLIVAMHGATERLCDDEIVHIDGGTGLLVRRTAAGQIA